MQIPLNKNSEVSVHEQLAEQIVFQITTGKLQPSELLPSVRTLARQLRIHHNTVSRSYRDLVSRGWLKRHRGSRLCVGTPSPAKAAEIDLDQLVNETIRRAFELGFSLQALRSKVFERLCAEPPDHILVVEDEIELRGLICSEIFSRVGKMVKACSTDEFFKKPELSLGAQVVAPEHTLPSLASFVPLNLPCMGLEFADATEHLNLIKALDKPSVVGIASVSKTFLRTARSLLAPVIGRRHSVQEFSLPLRKEDHPEGTDIIFCDSIAMPTIRSRRKIHYRLLANRSLEDLAVAMVRPIPLSAKLHERSE